jgi:hypothetical protein
MYNAKITRHLEVDVARLLMLVNQFALPVDDKIRQLKRFPIHPDEPPVGYFTPEYKLQKLYFLLRYPAYFANELIKLCKNNKISTNEHDEVKSIVRKIVNDKEPELRTDFYRKFLYGAHQYLDNIECYWHSRKLVYCAIEPRGDSRTQKYYFLTEKGKRTATNIITNVENAKWYDARIRLLYKYFEQFKPQELKDSQYEYEEYRNAPLNEEISDLSIDDVINDFEDFFDENF